MLMITVKNISVEAAATLQGGSTPKLAVGS